MEDWIRKVETLEGPDEYGNPFPLLEDYEMDDSPNSLQRRAAAFLRRVEANDVLIHEIRDHLINDVLGNTVKEIASAWGCPHNGVMSNTDLLSTKVCFLVSCFYCEMLGSEKWSDFHQEIYKSINTVLLAILEFAKEYPHKPKNSLLTTVHFKTKSFLANSTLWIWHNLFSGDTIKALTDAPLELLVPTMRKLGMMDVLDEDWNMYGGWDCILNEIGAGLPRVSADKALAEKSELWRKARASICCRRLSRRGYGSGDPNPICFQYFSKCSVDGCVNMEAASKKHPHRCNKCYYFHFCSDACKAYAEKFGMHDCEFTPPDKAAAIKNETEMYLGLNKKKKVSKHERCNFCRTKEIDMPPGKNLLQCSGCENVGYVSVIYLLLFVDIACCF